MPSTAKPAPRPANRWLLGAALLALAGGFPLQGEEVLDLPAFHVGETRLLLTGPLAEGTVQRVIDPGLERYSLPLLLQGLPGLVALESFGSIEPPRISIRGSALQAAPVARGFLPRWNGLPLCWADLSFNASWLDLALADELVVRRGHAGWLDATGTMGGSLELLSRAGFHPNLRVPAGGSGAASFVSRPELSFTLQMDGEGSHWTRLSASLQAYPTDAPPAELLLRASSLHNPGFRPYSEQDRQTAWLEFGEGANHFSLLALKGHYEVPGPLLLEQAYAATWTLPASVARDLPERSLSLQRLTWRSGFPCDSGWIEGGLGVQHSRDDFRQLQANGITHQSSVDGSFFLRWESTQDHAPDTALWTARLDLLTGSRRMERFLNKAALTGERLCDDRLEAQSHGLLLQHRRSLLPGLTAELGVGVGVWTRNRSNHQDITGTNLSRNWSDERFLPSVLLRKSFSKELELHAAWQLNAEAPSFDDLMPLVGSGTGLHSSNASLRTQTASTFELGLDWHVWSSRLELCVYDAAWNGELLRLADASGNALGTVNADRTRHRGLELGAQHRVDIPGGLLRFSQTLTLQELRFEDDPVRGDGRLGGLPPLTGRSTLRYEHRSSTWLAASLDYGAGRTQADHAGLLGYGGSAQLGLEAGWRIHKHLTVQAGVRNLLDRRAIASTTGVLDIARNPATTALFLPAPPRRCTVSVTTTW